MDGFVSSGGVTCLIFGAVIVVGIFGLRYANSPTLSPSGSPFSELPSGGCATAIVLILLLLALVFSAFWGVFH